MAQAVAGSGPTKKIPGIRRVFGGYLAGIWWVFGGYLVGIWRVFEWESGYFPRNYPTLQKIPKSKNGDFTGIFPAFYRGNTINEYPEFFFVGWPARVGQSQVTQKSI
jgi:hypothetical protein